MLTLERLRPSLDNLWPDDVCHALVFARSEGHVLLATKFLAEGTGHRRLNGYGIRIPIGASVIETAVEGFGRMTGLCLPREAFRHAADVDSLVYQSAEDCVEDYHHIARLYVFLAEAETRVRVPSIPEMQDPDWFPEKNLPWDEMFPGDQGWLGAVLAEPRYHGRVLKFVSRDHSLMDSRPTTYCWEPRDIRAAPTPDPADPRFRKSA